MFERVGKDKNELADRITAFRMKQERKREKIRKILEKRAAREAAGLLPSDGRHEVRYITLVKAQKY